MAYTLPQSADDYSTPSIVLVGVPNTKALERVIEKLTLHGIEFSAFNEPDDDLGLTAVSTVPLDEEQRVVLRNYRLWNESNQVSLARSSVVRAPGPQGSGGRRFESCWANQVSPLRSTVSKEQPVLTGWSWVRLPPGAPLCSKIQPMMIELHSWGVNTEIELIDDDGLRADRCYVLSGEGLNIDTPGIAAEYLFHYLETTLRPPRIGGEFGEFHPYWHERKAAQARRAAKLGIL